MTGLRRDRLGRGSGSGEAGMAWAATVTGIAGASATLWRLFAGSYQAIATAGSSKVPAVSNR